MLGAFVAGTFNRALSRRASERSSESFRILRKQQSP
jgi:hypothetical protein